MKVLLAPQLSEVEQAILDNRIELVHGKYISNGNGNYKWQDAVYEYKLTFDELCEKFPKNVIEMKDGESPQWGNSWYVADENGYPKVAAANWDGLVIVSAKCLTGRS
jgi:hypothetical protein